MAAAAAAGRLAPGRDHARRRGRGAQRRRNVGRTQPPARPPGRGRGRQGASLTSVPPFFVYLNGFTGTGETTEAIVRASVTGRIIARVRPPAPYTVFDKVTATGTDDHRFRCSGC